MKQKEGRDYLDLQECVLSLCDEESDYFLRISDMGASIYLTRNDWLKIVSFVKKVEKVENV